MEVRRRTDLKRMMKTTYKIVSIAIDNCCALEVIDGQYRILKTKSHAKAHKIFWKKGKFHKIEIPAKKEFQALGELLKK